MSNVTNNITVNNNFSFDNFGSQSANQFQLPRVGLGQVFEQISSILDRLAKSFDNISTSPTTAPGIMAGPGGCCCPSKPAPINPPNFWEGFQPKGSLKTEGNVITTAGGYKIEQQGQFNWKITGPDGKKTEIWGDPHVREGDGGAWDFKKNSIFKLPDGTEIKVNTVPYGNGMTVTGSLDITCGSDHITVSDIDKGMGKIGENQGDGILQRYGNDISGLDKFIMGRESDDWSLGGKEIVGSNNGGDSFKLGNDLPPGRATPPNFNNWMNTLQSLMSQLTGGGWGGNQSNNQFHPYRKPVDRGNSTQDNMQNDVMSNMRNGLRDLSKAFKVLARFADLSSSMNNFRNRGFYA